MKNLHCFIYLVRHGETEWNEKKLIQGHSDIPLNKKGEIQAKDLSKKLSHVKFAAVFSSDLIRAKRTAEIITLEKKIAVKTTKALRERYFGRFEGTSWEEDKQYQSYLNKFSKLSYKERYYKKPYEDTESDEKLMVRFIPFLRQVAVAYPGKNILIVTHGGVMRVFLIHLGYGTYITLPSGSINNTAYVKLMSDGVDFFIKETFGIEKKSVLIKL
jgi:broad specificity phosphatase PhoE